MAPFTAYYQLGRFVADFQYRESAVNEVIVLLAGGDDEVPRILVNDLEYGKGLNTADVLCGRFIGMRANIDPVFH